MYIFTRLFYRIRTMSGWLSGYHVRLSCSRLRVCAWSGHTKDHNKNGTNCLPAWHTMC